MPEPLTDDSVVLLPRVWHQGLDADAQRYLVTQAEVTLKHLLTEFRSGKSTWESLCCALGRIDGYYGILSELQRQRRLREEQRHHG